MTYIYPNEHLISVCVISCESEDTILKTLKSIENQSYKLIELIISDDGSNDRSADIAKTYLKNNEKRYASTSRIVRTFERTGTVKNIQRALRVANGDWVKLIAADDELSVNCILQCFQLAIKEQSEFIFSDVQLIDEDSNPIPDTKEYPYHLVPYFLKLPKLLKEKYIQHRNILPAPSIFLNMANARELYGNLEQIIIEDWPVWIKIIKNDLKVAYTSERLVKYRIHTRQTTSQTDIDTIKIIKNDISLISRSANIKFDQQYYLQQRIQILKKNLEFIGIHLILKIMFLAMSRHHQKTIQTISFGNRK